VAVVSTVPPDGYAAWDGTSVAAAHVSGLAALLLAHHPDFAGPLRARTAARVERLFDLLRRTARPLPVGDIRRTGAGLPDAVAAFRDVLPAGAAWWPEPTIDLTGALDPTSAPAGWGAPVDLSAPLDQLAAVLRDAGIVNGNGGNGHGNGRRGGASAAREAGGTAGRSRAAGGSPRAEEPGAATAEALARLQESLERAGLWET
jgi:subtilisin family serine protease